MINKKLNKLKEDILNIDYCKGIICNDCPLQIKKGECEVSKFQRLVRKRFEQFKQKPEKCPNCGKVLD